MQRDCLVLKLQSKHKGQNTSILLVSNTEAGSDHGHHNNTVYATSLHQ